MDSQAFEITKKYNVAGPDAETIKNYIKSGYDYFRASDENYSKFVDYKLTEYDKNTINNNNKYNVDDFIIYFSYLLEEEYKKNPAPSSRLPNLKRFFLVKKDLGGGHKKIKNTYTVKELKDIATKNKIKIIKKSNGKTVCLNKQELTTKLKKNKLI